MATPIETRLESLIWDLGSKHGDENGATPTANAVWEAGDQIKEFIQQNYIPISQHKETMYALQKIKKCANYHPNDTWMNQNDFVYHTASNAIKEAEDYYTRKFTKTEE